MLLVDNLLLTRQLAYWHCTVKLERLWAICMLYGEMHSRQCR